jgi:hypothetical protein
MAFSNMENPDFDEAVDMLEFIFDNDPKGFFFIFGCIRGSFKNTQIALEEKENNRSNLKLIKK